VDNATTKTKLLDLINRAHADERAFIAGLTEADRLAVGTPEYWSAKDLIAHVAEWRERLAQRLAVAQRGDPLPELRRVDEYNAEGLEANRHKTWTEVEAEDERAYAGMVAHISRLSADELANPHPRPIPWYSERPLRASILINSYLHPVTHLSEFYVHRGDTARARQILQASAQDLRDFEPSDVGRGLALYNLACLYAGMGEPTQAIALLREVFPYRPELKEWSKQDDDLAALRDLPEFQAL
jgi:hypothetical protein